MAEIIQDEGHKKGGKKRPKKHGTHIDMTPMVDLACLLLTFFMLTTAFSKPKVMEIVLPEKDDNSKAPEISEGRVVNIIISSDDRVFWYNGMIKPDEPAPELVESDFSKDGLRVMLLNRNKKLYKAIEDFKTEITTGKISLPQDSITARIRRFKSKDKTDKSGPIVLIKALEGAKYGNIVDIIDEMAITNIAIYALADISEPEKQLVEAKLASTPAPEKMAETPAPAK